MPPCALYQDMYQTHECIMQRVTNAVLQYHTIDNCTEWFCDLVKSVTAQH